MRCCNLWIVDGMWAFLGSSKGNDDLNLYMCISSLVFVPETQINPRFLAPAVPCTLPVIKPAYRLSTVSSPSTIYAYLLDVL